MPPIPSKKGTQYFVANSTVLEPTVGGLQEALVDVPFGSWKLAPGNWRLVNRIELSLE